MQRILRSSQAGTIESNDIMITIVPAEPGTGITVELISTVMNQYGSQIRAVIVETLQDHGIADATVHANDKGALDCTIRARVQTAIARAAQEKGA